MPTNETRRDWEVLQQNANDVTERLRIMGGWLYRTSTDKGVALVFIPAMVGSLQAEGTIKE